MSLPPLQQLEFQGILLSGPNLGALLNGLGEPLRFASGLAAVPLAMAAVLFLGALATLGLHSRRAYKLTQRLSAQQQALAKHHREQRLQQLQCAHDPLTGAFTRPTILELFQLEVERSKRFKHPCTVLLLSIDHFSSLNELYGIEAGNHILGEVVRQCRAHVRPFDMIGRFSGDEFLVILASADADIAARIAQRLHASLASTPVTWNGQAIGYTASLAYHSLDDTNASANSLLARCKKTLTHARENGTSQVAGAAGQAA